MRYRRRRAAAGSGEVAARYAKSSGHRLIVWGKSGRVSWPCREGGTVKGLDKSILGLLLTAALLGG